MTKIFEVDTVAVFRHKYLIEAKSKSDAMDEITMRESGLEKDTFEEASQRYLGETISNVRELTKDDADTLMISLREDSNELAHHGDPTRITDYDCDLDE